MNLPKAWKTDFKHSDKVPRALSYSASKELAKSPAHVKAYWESESKATKAMRIGKLYETIALSMEMPRDCFKWDELETAKAMCDVLARHELSTQMISQGVTEKTGYFKDPDFGFDIIIRPDILLPQYSTMVDLKSAADVSIRAFRKAVYWFKYHWQAFFYLRGANVLQPGVYNSYHIIAQETKPPYGIMVYKLSDATLTNAEIDMMPLLKLFKGCLDTGKWPLYPEEIIEI